MALQLNQRGYDAQNLHALLGGLEAWEAANYPIEGKVASDLSAPPEVSRPSDEVQRIDPVEAKALMDKGDALLYDVRSLAAYDARHAAGAFPLPEGDLGEYVANLPRDKLLILYCT